MKYKLIKEYPGSPKLGIVVEEDEGDYYIPDNNSKTSFTALDHYPYAYLEFWEKIVEKDYEILTYIHKASKCIWKKDSQLKNTFCLTDGEAPFRRLESILKYHENYLIYSIKRLSDGEVFIIGDKVFGCCHSIEYNISNFMVDKRFDKIIINGDTIHLNECKKVKQPLFTTEDGVDIYEGNKFWFVNNIKNNIYLLNEAVAKINDSNSKSVEGILDFSTKEKAKEYILMNKPCLSYKEASDIMLHRDVSAYYKKTIREELKELVKQKLNK